MDPNTQPQNQLQQNAVSTEPQSSAVSEQPMAQPMTDAHAAPQQKKSKKSLVIALAVGIPALLIIIAITFMVIRNYQAIQSRAMATAFMSDITSGDVDAAVKLSGDESGRSFLSAASTKLKDNSYALNANEYNASGDSYYLYTLSGGDYKSARVIVANENGKHIVNSFVYDTQMLALKPGSMNVSTPSAVETSTANCFAPSDYSTAFGYSNTLSFSETSPYTANVHFLADSLDYDGSYQQGYIDSFAKIVTTNPSKDYAIHVWGSTATTAASDKDFANQRAEKVKAALVADGVDATKITVDAAKNADDMGGATSETAKATARVVVMSFAPGCSTTDSSTDTSTDTGR